MKKCLLKFLPQFPRTFIHSFSFFCFQHMMKNWYADKEERTPKESEVVAMINQFLETRCCIHHLLEFHLVLVHHNSHRELAIYPHLALQLHCTYVIHSFLMPESIRVANSIVERQSVRASSEWSELRGCSWMTVDILGIISTPNFWVLNEALKNLKAMFRSLNASFFRIAP